MFVSLTASGQPANIDVVILDLLRVDEKEDLLSLLEVAIDSFSLSEVIVERIHIEEIALLYSVGGREGMREREREREGEHKYNRHFSYINLPLP